MNKKLIKLKQVKTKTKVSTLEKISVLTIMASSLVVAAAIVTDLTTGLNTEAIDNNVVPFLIQKKDFSLEKSFFVCITQTLNV